MEGKQLLERSTPKKLFELILTSISDPLIVLDKYCHYQYLNQSAEKYLGKNLIALKGKKIWDLYPILNNSTLKTFCSNALLLQENMFLEEYYPAHDAWVEFNIYPNPEGLVLLFKNITTRKKAEADNLKLIKRNALLIDTMRDMFLLLDEDLKVVDVNPAYCKALGYSKEEMLRMNVMEFESKHTPAELLRVLKENAKYETSLFDTTNKKRNGEIIDVEVTVVETMTEGRTHFATFGRDITAYKKAQVLLKENNARFELIGAATQEALWEVACRDNSRWANEVHQKMYGLTKSDSMPDAQEWEKRIHPSERERVRNDLQQAIIDQKTTWTAEYLFYTENKGWISIYDRTHIQFNEEREVIRMLGSMTNISDLKKAENQIMAEKNLSDSVINSLPGIFYMINKEGKILRWNNNFEKVSKYTSDEINSIHVLDLFHTDEKELLKAKITEVFENGRAEVETHFFTKDMEKVPYLLNGNLIVQNGQECLVGMGIDLTEIKKAEKSLRLLEQKILHQKVEEHQKIARAIINTQEKERNHIGAELHDNVNQLLAGARLYLNMAAKSCSKTRELVSYPVELIDDTIKEIRNLTSMHVTPVKNADLKMLIESLVQNLKETTGIQVRLQCEGDESIIPADLKINIYRILQELINNILKHAACKNVFLGIRCTEEDIEIMLKDDGKGFFPDQRKDGIGLGNITNRVNSFNGEICIESAPGKGCYTRIRIPLQPQK